MKRLLLVLSILFLALWIAGFFYPGTTTSIHIALMVALLFFIRSAMIIESPIKETQVKTVINSSSKKQDQENSMDTAKTAIKQIRSESNKQDVKVLS